MFMLRIFLSYQVFASFLSFIYCCSNGDNSKIAQRSRGAATEHIAVAAVAAVAAGIAVVENVAIVEKMNLVIGKGGKNHLHHHRVLCSDLHHSGPFIDSKLGVMRGFSFSAPSFSCGYLSRACFCIL